MSWGGSPLAFFVGERQVALWLGAQTFSADWVAGEPPPLATLLEQAGVKPRLWPLRHRVQIWLSGALARPFVLEPIAGLAGRDEALAAARARAGEETGWTPASVELWMERMPRDEPVLVVATLAGALRALRAAARQARLRVVSVRPWWSAALAAAAGQGRPFELLASADPEALVILGSRQALWTDGSTLSPLPDAAQCEAVVQRRITARGLDPAQAGRFVLAAGGPSARTLPVSTLGSLAMVEHGS